MEKRDSKIFQEFIIEVKNDLCNSIEKNVSRFPSSDKLLNRFKESSDRLLKNGSQYLRHFIETHNELCVAASLLEEPSLEILEYEPKIEICDKRFDFYFKLASRIPKWVEVKTIHPVSKDDWVKYKSDLNKGRFGDVELILEKEWGGGELYHNAIASRSKILEYVLETEEKIESCLGDSNKENTFLLFFSNGFDWHLDRLEDFVYFYRYGKHLPEDTFGTMEAHHIKENGIVLKGNIDFFAYMERTTTEIRPRLDHLFLIQS